MQEVVGVAEDTLTGALTELEVVAQILPVGQHKLFKLLGALLAVAEADFSESVFLFVCFF